VEPLASARTALAGKFISSCGAMVSVDSVKAAQLDNGRYRLLVEAIIDYAIYMLDPAGCVTSWNPGARRFKGYEEAEIIGHHFSEFYTEEDRAAGVPARALRTAAEEGCFEAEGWRVRKDGTRFWAHVMIDPIRTAEGELLGYAKITRDLTERRKGEEILRRSEEQFRLLVQGVTDYAIYMLDLDGFVTNWNPGAQRIKGYLPAEIIGQHFSRFYTDADRRAGEPDRALMTAMRDGRFEKEGWRVRKDGSRFFAHVVIDPIRDDYGKAIGFAKITRDITERRQAQQALEQTRQALFHSQKLDAIGQLTGGVAHDFNNLLMAVLGSLELLRKRLPDDDAKAMSLLNNAVLGAQRGAILTQRLLAFRRKQDLSLGGVDLEALVRGMTGLLHRSIGPSVRLTTRFARDLAPAFTDANQLETALLNLAVNARDAMPNGGELLIEGAMVTLPEDAPIGLPAGDYVRLAMVDQGEGMNEETLARASEPFYTTKGFGKGTGLGLSMVHGLAEQSGGRLVLESAPGEGARIELWLPRADSLRAERPDAPKLDVTAPVRPLVVLAVDDDSLVLVNTAALLEDLGHVVLVASSASEALATVRTRPIDVVITDYAMPQMTGLQLAEAIKASRPDLPVALATGYAELPPGEGRSLPRLAKPYSQAELAQFLQGVATAHEDAV